MPHKVASDHGLHLFFTVFSLKQTKYNREMPNSQNRDQIHGTKGKRHI